LVGGTAVFGFQLLFLLANSLRIYHRFALTQDFASYYQAWFLIVHGHFSPYDSIFGMPFLKSHFELLLWPLSLIYWLYPHGVTLLWLQDLAMVGAEIVALLWALDAMDRHPDLGLPPRVVASAGMVALLVLNPWFYRSAAFDFHLEAFATLFAVLAARNMYGGRAPPGPALGGCTPPLRRSRRALRCGSRALCNSLGSLTSPDGRCGPRSRDGMDHRTLLRQVQRRIGPQ
jgi:hypothetical protein